MGIEQSATQPAGPHVVPAESTPRGSATERIDPHRMPPSAQKRPFLRAAMKGPGADDRAPVRTIAQPACQEQDRGDITVDVDAERREPGAVLERPWRGPRHTLLDEPTTRRVELLVHEATVDRSPTPGVDHGTTVWTATTAVRHAQRPAGGIVEAEHHVGTRPAPWRSRWCIPEPSQRSRHSNV